MIAYRPGRSHAWNAAHPPRLPPRPRRLAPAPVTLFGRRVESPLGIAAGPLPNARWVAAYARLGYGLLTYATVRTAARPAAPMPNVVFCTADDPAVVTAAPRKPDPADLTWAVSFGQPSAPPETWRADVRRARKALGPEQLLIVSVAPTAVPGADADTLARDVAQAAMWAAEAGADVVEVHLAAIELAPGEPRTLLPYEDRRLAAVLVERVRRTLGTHPVVAKLGAAPGPRALHELATRIAPWVDGFVLVSGLVRRVLRPDGTPAFPGPGRDQALVVGGRVWDACRIQVEELLAWRKAGAWNRAVLATGGITTVERARSALAAGCDAVMLGTGALVDPLLAARWRGTSGA